jgi:ankyrin repeat protein
VITEKATNTLKYNADVTLANSYGKTALNQALDHKQSEAAVALLKHTR